MSLTRKVDNAVIERRRQQRAARRRHRVGRRQEGDEGPKAALVRAGVVALRDLYERRPGADLVKALHKQEKKEARARGKRKR